MLFTEYVCRTAIYVLYNTFMQVLVSRIKKGGGEENVEGKGNKIYKER